MIPRVAALLGVALMAVPAAGVEAGGTLPAWSPGQLDIHQISSGRGNSALVVLPDGTTLLIDAGDAGDLVPLATALPDDTRGAGAWIARYIRRMRGEDAVLDYAVVTHFHRDHVGGPTPQSRRSEAGGFAVVGLAEVAESVPIRTLIDRGYPDYGEPAPPKGEIVDNYRAFATWAAAHSGTVRQRIRVGSADQIVERHDAAAFPGVEVRAVAGNGLVWTGSGDETVDRFPPQETLPDEDRASENLSSIALRIRYGDFTFFTGGDLFGLPEPGAPAWWDLETPVARAIGATDVVVLAHHGSIEPANPFFLATTRPRVIIVPAWSPTHPSPDVVKRLLSTRIWPDPRDVFVTHLRDATRATIGPRAERLASAAGHVVVRVDPGGDAYRVYVLDDETESYSVTSLHGPYTAHRAPAP